MVNADNGWCCINQSIAFEIDLLYWLSDTNNTDLIIANILNIAPDNQPGYSLETVAEFLTIECWFRLVEVGLHEVPLSQFLPQPYNAQCIILQISCLGVSAVDGWANVVSNDLSVTSRSDTKMKTLLYRPFHSKWDHYLQNDHHTVESPPAGQEK